ncbi:MAG: tetratricopeptide repeat protein [Bacteroidales bacterium]|nr:tetratricopeptide repeat protein [Bacteroidales bacterium]
MAGKKETSPVNTEQMFEETVSRLETWFLKNQKRITTVAVAVVILVGGYFGYKFLYLEPRERAAQEEMFFAQNYFEIDSLNWALNGDGINYGFIDIIDNFRGTKAANLSHYYVGVIYLRKGQYEEAIDYLRRFRSNDLILTPMVRALIGDCHAELGDMREALLHYERAVSSHQNDMVTPMVLMKAAALCDIQGDYQKALKFYTRVRNEYIRTPEARDVDKYIAMMEAKINQ